MKEISDLVQRLEDIANKNDDVFRYRIEIDVENLRREKFRYRFIAEETADGHTFADGSGATLDEAISSVDLKEACEQWGYEIQ